MYKKFRSNLISVLVYALILLVVGLVVWFFFIESKMSFQDVLFYIGATPIALFSIGLFGDFLGRGTQSYQLSRSVSKQSPNQRAKGDVVDNKKRVTSGISWIAAGLLVWLVSYFIGF